MTDTISRSHRSWNMSRIRGKDTTPEKVVRSALHRKGYRFRLHRKDLKGKPDIVLPKHHTVIFVNGCFWHRHPGCKFAYSPKSRKAFWQEKFAQTAVRDEVSHNSLMSDGWKVAVIWECETKDAVALDSLIRGILEPQKVDAVQQNYQAAT